MAAQQSSLRLYAILDAETCQRRKLDLHAVADALAQGGIRLLQYRDKLADSEAYLQNARTLRERLPADLFLLLNDHVHLVAAAGADGVHVGQTDCALAEAREAIGPDRILGISTHSADQALAGTATVADYLAIGPVFPTVSKKDAEPAVGICGVQAARAVVCKPLVAIGGIGLDSARAVRHAGADAVALISALLPGDGLQAISARAQDFLARLK